MEILIKSRLFCLEADPEDRKWGFFTDLFVYFAVLVAMCFVLAANAGDQKLYGGPLFLVTIGGTALLAQVVLAMALMKKPLEYIDRLVLTSRTGALLVLALVAFAYLLGQSPEQLWEVSVGALAFMYLFVWVGHLVILITQRISFLWYLSFTLFRLGAIAGWYAVWLSLG